MSETFHIRFEAETTEAEHEIFAKAFADDEELVEFAVTREGGKTIINAKDDGVSRTQTAEKAIERTIRRNGLPVVFAYEGDQEYGDAFCGTISREGNEELNVWNLLLEKAVRMRKKLDEAA